jgi:tRNA pseudouridine38-40 synthase
MRYALCLEYQGSDFHGFQKQNHQPHTIQGYVEAALSFVADEPITLVCAGRTDAGVHATHQIIHFDTHAIRTERSWVLGSNSRLPPTIRVRWAKAVSEAFHARFSAESRTYQYVILAQPVPPAIMRPLVTWEMHPLNVGAMEEGAQYWLGEHDFTSFRAQYCQAKHPIRTVEALSFQETGPLGAQKIVCSITANAFLHHMVRNMLGTLLLIGRGEHPPEWAKSVLDARNRVAAGPTAPPNGLYLTGVRYSEAFGVPSPFACHPSVGWGPV